MASPQQLAHMSAPYPPQTWSLGGRVEAKVDIPITAVFLALFIVGAAGHMTIFQRNKRRGHKFLLSLLMFGFCMCRIVTMTLRIASSTRPKNIPLSIAAGIFVAAGVLLIYVVNLLFAQRLIRARHPKLGWSKPLRAFFIGNYVLIVISLIMVIVVTVQTFYTLSTNTHRIDRDIQLYTATYFSLVSFLPIPLTLVAFGIPPRTVLEKFGSGRYGTKVAVLLGGSFLLCLGACYRCGTSWLTPVSVREPLPDYFSKACFYIFDFTIEIVVVLLYLVVRIDQRFHVPNGSSKRCSYIIEDPLKDKDGYRRKQDSLASNIGSTRTSDTEFPRMYTQETIDTDVPHKEDKKGILKVNTKFSEKQRQADLEAQVSEPHSAMTGTTAAALSRDHLLLPEQPERAHVSHHSLRDPPKALESVPPVPQIPDKLKRERERERDAPTPNAALDAPSRAPQDSDKLDKVVDLLVSLDRRLSTLEDKPVRPPSTFDLLDRLDRRLSALSTTPGPALDGYTSPYTAYPGSGIHSPYTTGSPAPRPQSGFDLLERLDRRLSMLEQADTHHHNQTPGLESLLALDRRLSRIESFSPHPQQYPTDTNIHPSDPRLSRHSRWTDSHARLSSPLHSPPDTRYDRHDLHLGGHSPVRGRAASPRRSPDRFALASPNQNRMTRYFGAGPTVAGDVVPEDERETDAQQQQQVATNATNATSTASGAPRRDRHVSWRTSAATATGNGNGSRVDLNDDNEEREAHADDEGGVGEAHTQLGASSPSSGEFHSVKSTGT